MNGNTEGLQQGANHRLHSRTTSSQSTPHHLSKMVEVCCEHVWLPVEPYDQYLSIMWLLTEETGCYKTDYISSTVQMDNHPKNSANATQEFLKAKSEIFFSGHNLNTTDKLTLSTKPKLDKLTNKQHLEVMPPACTQLNSCSSINHKKIPIVQNFGNWLRVKKKKKNQKRKEKKKICFKERKAAIL